MERYDVGDLTPNSIAVESVQDSGLRTACRYLTQKKVLVDPWKPIISGRNISINIYLTL